MDSDDYFWAMYLYEENAKSSIPSYAHWLISGEENEQTENIGLPAGTYYIKVISHHTRCDTSTYTLRVHYTESDTYETEENNDFWLADEISVNADYCGSMMSHRDCDHYVVTIPEEGYVSLKLDHSLYESGPTWYLSLYESDQQTRVAGEAWKISSDSNFTSDAYLLPAGTYYIMITRYVISIENIIGDYTLHVNFEAVGQSDE